MPPRQVKYPNKTHTSVTDIRYIKSWLLMTNQNQISEQCILKHIAILCKNSLNICVPHISRCPINKLSTRYPIQPAAVAVAFYSVI